MNKESLNECKMPVLPWTERESDYETLEFSQIDRMGDEIKEWRELYRASTQAAANKAAEEGGLPALPKQPEELKAHWLCEDCGGRGHDGEMQWQGHFQPPEPTMCGTCQGAGRVECEALLPEQAIEYARQAIAADRASRQVANKAEVEGIASSEIPEGWPTEIWLNAGDEDLAPFSEYDELSWCSLPQGENDIRYVREDLLATPPATTGASTVLTDERIEKVWSELSLTGAYNMAEARALFAKAIAREVAAQAGQVAVPEDAGQPMIGKLLDQFSELPVLWGLNEPGALVRHGDVFKMLVTVGKEYAPSPAKESK